MMIENILPITFCLLLIYYVYFLLNILKGLGKLEKKDGNRTLSEFVSVIIPFRNEKDNLLKNLKSLEEQTYPKDKYEIIYVNDSSTDNSIEIIETNRKNENIKVISVPENFSPNAHKKRAIKFGIENSRGEIIITTDADCTYNQDWLYTLLKYLDDKTAFVSGPVEFEDDNGKFFDKLQKIEFAGLVISGAGLIGSNRPAICNAANIAYRKKIFEQVKGFDDHMKLSSGDDELLMQKIWKETDCKIKFCPDKKAVVKTAPNKSLRQFYQQRKRWASKSLFYADKLLILKLILIFFFYLSLPVQLILALFLSTKFFILLCISLLLKAFFEYQVLKRGPNFCLIRNY